MTQEAKNDDSEILRCCSGFCVDLLLKFASDLSFDFQMTRYDLLGRTQKQKYSRQRKWLALLEFQVYLLEIIISFITIAQCGIFTKYLVSKFLSKY